MQDWISTLGLEEEISQEVRLCGERINSSGIWWKASRNYEDTEVFSCRHAVKFRERLGSGGNGGIPLWAELYSLIGIAIDSKNQIKIPFVAHTRANTEFSDTLIIQALELDSDATKIIKYLDENHVQDSMELKDGDLTIEEKKTSKSKYYGRVNPFNINLIFEESLNDEIKIEDICQIFDKSLLLHGGFPNTVMSNLGDRRLAFELHPDDLIKIVKKLSPSSFVAKITEFSQIWLGLDGKQLRDYWLQFPPPKGPKIGILTGNAPESGITLWKDILKAIRNQYENLADVLMPEIHIHSLPQMGLSMELVSREDRVWDEMKNAVIALLELGCKIITLACNTTIYYEPRIIEFCEKYQARFVSIAEACMPSIKYELNKRGVVSSVGLVGIGPVIDMKGNYSGYKRHLERVGINIDEVKPCPGEDIAYKLKNIGDEKKLVKLFIKLINQELPDENVIVLALTEVSMVYREHVAIKKEKYKNNKAFIDPLLELGKFLAFIYLSQGYKECAVCQIPEGFPIEEKLINSKAVENPFSRRTGTKS